MTNQISVKTNFTSGQLSPRLYGRGDLKVFANGAAKLHNVLIYPTGGVSRRHGMRFVDNIAPGSRLVSFEFNTDQTYLLCFEPSKLKIFKNDLCIAQLNSPWNAEHLKSINWAQSADTLLVVHPDVSPRQISRNNKEVWTIAGWQYVKESNVPRCPYGNFFQKKIAMRSTLNWGYDHQQVESDTDIFDKSYLNTWVQVQGGYGEIIDVVNTHAIGVFYRTMPARPDRDYNWREQVFSPRRGYPRSIAFHQDRMVLGGSKEMPNHLWFSKSSDLFNFNTGDGKDTDSIDFAILSDQVNAITNVVSGRHLQVFTTGSEWMVTGDPLTPTRIQLSRQTNIGSYNKGTLIPQNVDGATLFVSQNGRQLREFLYADVDQSYQAKDLTLLSTDIVKEPTQMVYHQDASILYIILSDGSVSCLTSYRSEEVNAWSKLFTDGKFKSIAVIGDNLYFAIERDGVTTLERMDADFQVDCGMIKTAETPQKIWTGLDFLEGKEVNVVADGVIVGKLTVIDGSITLASEAKEIVVGIPFEHLIEPLPLLVDSALPYFPKAYRAIYGLFRLLESQSLQIDFGNGLSDVPLRKIKDNADNGQTDEKYTGDVELRSLGWIRDLRTPMWRIKSDKPCSFTLLGATIDVKLKE